MAKLDKQRLLDAMSAHVLAHGLNGASLRPLAKAAGTSDRMLIYHFGSKDALIADLLQHLATQMAAGLSAALPPEPAPTEAACLRQIIGLLRQPAIAPYMRVWFDILSAASRKDAAHLETTRQVLQGYIAWIVTRLPADLPNAEARAAEMLTLIEGVLVLDMAGFSDAADAAIARFYPAGEN